MDVTFRFGGLRRFDTVTIGIDDYDPGDVTEPSAILVSFSDDGATFGPPLTFQRSDGSLPAIPAGARGDVTLNLGGHIGNYARLHFVPAGWIFLDEVAFDVSEMLDACHTTACNPATGACGTPVPDGTPCDDGNACTQADSCHAGVCAGTPVSCGVADPCRVLGTCDPASGACSPTVPVADGTTCSVCGVAGACADGTCQPGATPDAPYREDFESGIPWFFTSSVSYLGPNAGRNFAQVHGLISTASGTEEVHGKHTLKLGSDLHQMTYTGADWFHPFSGEVRSPPFPMGRSISLWRNVQASGLDALDGGLGYVDGYYLEVRDYATNQVLVVLERYDGSPVVNDVDPQLTDLGTQALVDTSKGALRGFVRQNVASAFFGRKVYLAAGFWTNDGQEAAFLELDDIVVANVPLCDDNNPCTDDTCDVVQGCMHAPVAEGTFCDDGNLCVEAETCHAGACQGGDAVTCAVPGPCQQGTGTCSPATGCSYPAGPDGVACDDGNPCTSNDVCLGGVCKGQDDQCAGITVGQACAVTTDCPASTICASGACALPASCLDLLHARPGLPDGVYLIDPDGGSTSDALPAFCDMTTDGGGWTALTANGDNSVDYTISTGCYPLISNDPDRGCGSTGNLLSRFVMPGPQQAALSWRYLLAVAYGPTGYADKQASFAIDFGSDQPTVEERYNGVPYAPVGLATTYGEMHCTSNHIIHYGKAGTFNPCANCVANLRGTIFGHDSATTMNSGARQTFGFTDAISNPPSQTHGVDDYQDGWSCGDVWAPQQVRGGRMVVLVKQDTCGDGIQDGGESGVDCGGPCAPCADGVTCRAPHDCASGFCVGGICVEQPTCVPSDACHVAGVFDAFTLTCSNPTAPDGTTCDDGNACTQGDACKGGVCTGTVTVTCTPLDACHVAGTCDPATGACSNPAAPDGTSCTNANPCIQGSTCQGGTCAGGTPQTTCPPSDACHLAGVCDPATGACTSPPAPDGTPCDDGNPCTQGDACHGGVCTGGAAVTCAALDACHLAGVCDPATGGCTSPPAPDGTACDDGNACTQGDACHGGVCAGTVAVKCAAIDACHVAGTCDPATGACSNPPAMEGAACDDGNPCTQGETCRSGVCTGGAPVVCVPSDPCHKAGVCDPATGICSNPPANNGLSCVNHPPKIVSTPVTTAQQGKAYDYPVLAQDADGDALTFTLVQAPAGMTIAAQTGLVTWTPGPSDAGAVPVTVQVQDTKGATDAQSYTLAVTPGGQPPKIVSTPPLVGAPGAIYAYPAAAVDASYTQLSWFVVGPPGMSVDASGLVTWSVPAGAAGSYPVVLTVTDPGGGSDAQVFSVGVATAADTTGPTVAITSPADGSSPSGAIDVVGTATDDTALAGYTLQLCRSWGGGGCTLLKQGLAPVSNGVLGSFNPQLVADGTWSIVLTATDAAGNSASASANVLVKTGARKPGVLRLDFPELTITTLTSEITIHRIYDGLDLAPGPLGNGWRYEWDVGHIERPQLMQDGWSVDMGGGFIPSFQLDPTVDHPINVVLDDGRVYQFDCFVQTDNTLGSILPVQPTFPELTATGSTLTPLRSDMSAYSTSDFSDGLVIGVGQDTVFEDDSFSTPWEPAYYRLTTQFGETYVFDPGSSHAISITQPSGVRLDLSSAGASIDGTSVLELSYGESGNIAQATNLISGATVQYQQDGNGDLVQVTTAAGTVQTFTYAPGSRLVSWSDGGLTPEQYVYDDQGRVIQHVAPSGAVMGTQYDDVNHRQIVTDAAGNTLISELDASGNPIRVTDPLGNVTTYTYVPGTSMQATKTDPLGNTWQFQYDARGRRTVTVDPLGNATTLAYDAATGHILSAVDGEGRAFTEQLDARGRVTAHVLPDGTVAASFTYPDDHTMVQTDAQGRSITRSYDPSGRVVARANAYGTATASYDDAHGTVAFVGADGTRSSGNLDPLGRFTRLATPDSGVFQYVYGATPLPDHVVRPDGGRIDYQKTPGGQLTQIVTDGQVAELIQYDGLGRVVSVRRDGEARTYQYDAAGRVTKLTTPSGTLSYAYDPVGRVTSLTSDSGLSIGLVYDAAGRPIAYKDGSNETYEITWDKSGRILSAIDGEGRTYAAGYDANGRQNQITYPGGLTGQVTYLPSDDLDSPPPIATLTDLEGILWSYGYDVDESLTTITDPTGGTTSYTRLSDHRVAQVTDALGRLTAFTWSGQNLTRLTMPSGAVQSFAFDGAGRPSSWTRADGSVVGYSYGTGSVTTLLPSGGAYTQTTYADVGATIDQGAPGGTVTEWQNESGATKLVELDDGASTVLAYRADGRVARVTATTPGGASFEARYGYDDAGHLTSVVDPDGGTTAYTYDVQGRIVRVDRPNGTHTEMAFGALDRPLSVLHYSGANVVASYTYTYDANGRVVAATTPEGSFEYGYDALSRLAVERTLSGGVVIATTTRTYDAVGNLITKTDASGTTTYTYDADDRLLSASGPSGVTTYAYNGRGALVEIDAPEGSTTYVYDDLDRLISVTTPDGQQVSYAYDGSGRRLARTDASGTRRCLPMPRTALGYDDCAVTYATAGAEAPQAQVFGAAGVASLHGAAGGRYLLGANGGVVGSTDAAGAVDGRWAYDAWGARTAASGGETGYGFDGERQDPVTGLVFLRSRWYAPDTGRFLTPDRAGAESSDPRSLHRYAFAYGNPLNRADPSGRDGDLVSLNTSLGINNVLESINDTLKACAQQQIKADVFNMVITWATTSIVDSFASYFTGALRTALPSDPSTITEGAFQTQLGKLLCGKSESDGTSVVEFEWKVGQCGDDIHRQKSPIFDKLPGLVGTIANYFDCFTSKFSSRGITGIDVVFDGVFGVELKLWYKTYDPSQLVRFCRWGAAKGLHTFMYMWVKFPDLDQQKEFADFCWNCWNKTSVVPGCGKVKGSSFGSIYLGLGVSANNQGDHAYRAIPGTFKCTGN